MSSPSLGSKGSQQLITRAVRDSAFRQRLILNPRDAIREELGIEVPAGFQITVLEETPSQGFVILPPGATEGELNDSELDLVAGGRMASGDCTCCFGSTSLRTTSAATCGEKC